MNFNLVPKPETKSCKKYLDRLLENIELFFTAVMNHTRH